MNWFRFWYNTFSFPGGGSIFSGKEYHPYLRSICMMIVGSCYPDTVSMHYDNDNQPPKVA